MPRQLPMKKLLCEQEARTVSDLSHSIKRNESKQVILCSLVLGQTTGGTEELTSQQWQHVEHRAPSETASPLRAER